MIIIQPNQGVYSYETKKLIFFYIVLTQLFYRDGSSLNALCCRITSPTKLKHSFY